MTYIIIGIIVSVIICVILIILAFNRKCPKCRKGKLYMLRGDSIQTIYACPHCPYTEVHPE